MTSCPESPFGPFLTNTFGDRYLYPINREGFNRVGSEILYRQRYSHSLSLEKTLHIIIGLDSGLLLNYVQKQTPPAGSHFLFVELPEVLDRLQSEGLLDSPEDHISYISGPDFLDKLQTLEFREYFYLDRVQLWQSMGAEDAHLPEYLELYWTARDQLEYLAWDIKSSLGTQAFIERQLENLAENRVSAECLNGLFKGKTAVLLAGGPSLDDILPWVKSHRSQLVVLAVSRIARRLQELEIIPDLVFSIDPHPVSFDVSKEMLLFGEQTLFVNLYHVVTPLLSNWQGRSVFLGPSFPWETNLNNSTSYSSGPTVTNVALAAAIDMGFSQVVLAGVDLCFSRTGHSHALGSNEAKAGPQFGKQDTRVETNGGWQAYTMNQMAQAIAPLGMQAKAALERNCQFVNPAAAAAKIPHILHQALDEIDLKPLQDTPWQSISRALPEDSGEARRLHYQSMLDELTRARTKLQQITKLCTLAVKYNDGLFGRKGMTQNFKYKGKLDRIEKELNRDYKDFTPLIKKFGLREFLKLSTPTASETWSDEEIEAMGRQYYQTYRDSVARLLKLVDSASQRLEERLQEENDPADIDLLLNNWQTQQESGRAQKWCLQHAKQVANAPPATQQKLEQLNADFHAMIADRNTEHMAKRKADADPQIARKRALLLFRKKDLDAMQDLLDGLASMKREAAKPIQNLVAGYVAELQNKPDQALNHYQEIVSEPLGTCTEEALRRILSISLGHSDSENALLALDCLSGLSPVYIPQYADLLRVVGEPGQALDRYADYLEQIPDDPLVLMKVGKLYQELGMSNEALTVFRYLLEKDPQSRTYQQLIAELENEQQGAEKHS